jgi:hypothetical protein
LGQFQVLTGFIRSGICAPGSSGPKKSPRALRAWRAEAGDNFFKDLFWFVFSIDWEKMNIHLLKQPTADYFKVAKNVIRQKLVEEFLMKQLLTTRCKTHCAGRTPNIPFFGHSPLIIISFNNNGRAPT